MAIEPIPIPPRAELYELFIKQNKTNYALAKYLKVAESTCKTWLLTYGLIAEKKLLLQQTHDASMQQRNDVIECEFVTHPESDIVTPSLRGDLVTTEASLFIPSPLANAHGSYLTTENDTDEPKSAYEQLSFATRNFVDLYVEQRRLPKEQRMTQEQMGEKLGRSAATISDYLMIENVRTAIEELSKPMVKFKVRELTEDKLIETLQSPGRINVDYLELGAKISGMIEEGITFNFNSNTVNKDSRINRKGS